MERSRQLLRRRVGISCPQPRQSERAGRGAHLERQPESPGAAELLLDPGLDLRRFPGRVTHAKAYATTRLSRRLGTWIRFRTAFPSTNLPTVASRSAAATT